MNIDKGQIIELLTKQGQGDKAARAERELPDQVDTDKDQGLLAKLGLDVGDLVKLVSGGGLGDVGGKLGGFLK
jgi:hypothetical protein